ncbi:hypothetical protein SAMN04490220_7149 [Rhodococcus jostii]|uniref:Uncharacterized protein n=1 Tax=Rhodococcus jostii TaxID=132919 RepID=A0A1H5HBK1_RHOJO|nr:hypothetical protein SAMN04490220_7149 [Rhodococcus jostii]
MNQIQPGRPATPTVDAKRLWAGGAAAGSAQTRLEKW